MSRFLRSPAALYSRALISLNWLARAFLAIPLLCGAGGEMLGPLDMQAGALTDEEWQVVRREIDGPDGDSSFGYEVDRYISEGVADTPDGVWSWIRRENVFTARIDLDGDGGLELVVLIQLSFFCGSAGCDGALYTRKGGTLELVQGLTLGGGSSVCLAGRGSGGTPYLFMGSSVLWWTGSRYEWVFINQDNSEILQVGPGERALIYAFSETQRECFGQPDESPQWP